MSIAPSVFIIKSLAHIEKKKFCLYREPLGSRIKMKIFFIILIFFISRCSADDSGCLFRDLALAYEIDHEIHDELPFFYNSSFVVGYFTMPSARFPKSGDINFGVASVPPYWVFGANFAVFSRIELSANYRVFRGVEEENFGREGFGDDADRIGNVKFGILMPEDGFPFIPSIAFGLDDVVGTKRFSSQYFVATKTWKQYNFELSLGYGWGRIKGLFGGGTWTPFRCTEIPILKNISLLVEYDANNYKKHRFEHFKGRTVSSRFNGGISYLLGDTLQLSLNSVRGEKIGGSASIRFPLGSTKGIIPKVDDPCDYTTPVDTEPMGPVRPEKEFVCDLACSFADQGLDLYDAYLVCDSKWGKQLYLRVVNNRYRQETALRQRIQDLLAALTPSNISSVKVVIEAEGVESHSYCFRTCDLFLYRQCCVTPWEIETLSPMSEVGCSLDPYDAHHLFQRQREVWTMTVRPRVISFFGSTSGKFKYSLGLLGAFEGFLPGGLTYRLQGSYSIYSSMHGLLNRDRLNPSELLHVRTDAVKYYQGGRVRLEEFFLQKSWNVGSGWFYRLAGGYFEPAYGGGATELLYYPVQSNWAVGAEVATVWKRKFTGLGFTNEVLRFTSNKREVKEHFIGLQYFLDLYYDFKPLDLLFEARIGQFLAKDKGVRLQVTRYFPSGSRFSLWLTVTNGNDKVNGRTYFDKGFAFYVPFDIFLKKSSRTFLTNAMSAWLRDVGAIAETGNTLYPTLYEERYD
ncbi:MAG: hypothetical protein K1000chlam2_00680 [Chlamydiae bacterium]|nr:hypothetical protein [Chlamydiota bacterium]